ncbi:hypothetical protein PG987_013884 [Apiospora arundinis]
MVDGVDVPNRGPKLQAVSIGLVSLAVTATALRCYTRTFILKAFGMDDAVMVFATISFVLFAAFALTGVHYGTGRHNSDLKKEDVQDAMKVRTALDSSRCSVSMTSFQLSGAGLIQHYSSGGFVTFGTA